VIWSKETKDGLLRHNDRLIMVDALGSSEAIGMATNTTTADSGDGTAKFELGPNTRVVTEDGRDVEPGSGEIGRVALRGYTPIGYYKDEEKSAATFQVIDGVRYSIPGDWAEVLADGSVKLLGRGSQCINTGGEKVYPEEVEECLKLHPPWPTPRWSACPTSASARRSTPSSSPQRTVRRARRRGRADRPREAPLARYKAPKPSTSSPRSGGRSTASSTTSDSRRYAVDHLPDA
jgi:acyl-CoA synthetase (AMP-forming)/AMP-acid ligase II